MKWNWQIQNWPNWSWESSAPASGETSYLIEAGRLSGTWQHLDSVDRNLATVSLLALDALRTSKIEGKILDRASVQSSVRRAFGMTADRRSGPAEGGIAELVSRGFQTWAEPISDEMAYFIQWFNETAPGNEGRLLSIARAGLAHLWFFSIHPFEGGNGRIARAESEKVLAQGAWGASLAALATRIEAQRIAYFTMLETNNKKMEITPWLEWFAETVLESQKWSGRMVEHLIAKTRVKDRLRDQLNNRQTRALVRMFDAGPEGFTSGIVLETTSPSQGQALQLPGAISLDWLS